MDRLVRDDRKATVTLRYAEYHFTQIASTVTRSQSNRAALGCGGTGDSKSAATA